MTDLTLTNRPVLLFDWQQPRGEKLAITGFLAGSTLLHAIAFYLFQIAYPSAIALLPPTPRLSLIAANSDEGRTVLQWVAAEDPALASATVRPAETTSYALPVLRHVPSYLLEQPKLKQLPPLKSEIANPSSLPAGPAPTPRLAPAPAVASNPTHLLVSDELTNLGRLSSPSVRFVASTNDSPENVQFRIAVSPSGSVRYCFRLNSSGDPVLDEQARHYLVLSRFPTRAGGPDDGSVIWGTATIEWGNDIAPPPASSATPPP